MTATPATAPDPNSFAECDKVVTIKRTELAAGVVVLTTRRSYRTLSGHSRRSSFSGSSRYAQRLIDATCEAAALHQPEQMARVLSGAVRNTMRILLLKKKVAAPED